MGFDFKEIVQSWYDTLGPNKDVHQVELAEKRYEICLGCEHFRPNRFFKNDSFCNDCGCPLKAKIYSKKFNACPKRKWIDIEKEYENHLDKPQKRQNLL